MYARERFCPSVFIYLGLVVPAIWLLELHKVDLRVLNKSNAHEVSTTVGYNDVIPIPGGTKIPTEMWVTLIEQFLMLILIVGRWLLPKGDLTRDQLSQLLLVYIGTAADIIEFFDSFKDETLAYDKPLVLLTLGIWSWSLVQFTVVLTATKSRKSRGTAHRGLRRERLTIIDVSLADGFLMKLMLIVNLKENQLYMLQFHTSNNCFDSKSTPKFWE
ncbi:Transmembrane protein 26 [Eumeta japonica]|uniref:Transmembrane protein 26 n=1 Tax=Eumeta variegata TaxID=151549 RepID=A0A4C1TJG4_EUMVA|nr:Transmembrane protein 26 [Eumeta japonica]